MEVQLRGSIMEMGWQVVLLLPPSLAYPYEFPSFKNWLLPFNLRHPCSKTVQTNFLVGEGQRLVSIAIFDPH